MDVKHINPFIRSASNVFDTMLGCELRRESISLKEGNSPQHEISGVIGLSGNATGSVVFSLCREVAYAAVEAMLGGEPTEMNDEVIDAVGELTNMIAGGAKKELSEFQLSLGLPNVIVGRNHIVSFPGNVRPLCVQFRSDWGLLSLEVGLDTHATNVGAAAAEQPVAVQ